MDFEPPAWAAWRGGIPSSPFTLGIEEEVMLLNASAWSLAYAADEVIADLPSDLTGRVSLETHAAVIELQTGIHTRVADAVTELWNLRSRLAETLAPRGLAAATAGTHPPPGWGGRGISSPPPPPP